MICNYQAVACCCGKVEELHTHPCLIGFLLAQVTGNLGENLTKYARKTVNSAGEP
jgi:hypothetical protein